MSDQTDRDLSGNGLSMSGWGGTLRATGPNVILFLLLIAGFASNGLIMWFGFRDIAVTVSSSRTMQVLEHQAILAGQDNLACVLMLPQEDRIAAVVDPLGICHYVRTIYRARRPGP